MDEFDGNSKDLNGPFKIPLKNKFEVNYISRSVTAQKNSLLLQMVNAPFMVSYLPKMNTLIIGCQDPMEDTTLDLYQKLAVA